MKNVSREEASKAKETLKARFHAVASLPLNGIGIAPENKAGHWHIVVNLTRAPSKDEQKHLPGSVNGVAVKYRQVGRIVAH